MNGLLQTTANGALPDAAHIIQVALTPVFLLSGIGTLLGMFNLRLARVSDHVSHVDDLLKAAADDEVDTLFRHMRRLRRRMLALDLAIALGALAGASTCAAAFAIFVVTLRDISGNLLLLVLFGMALGCTIAALTAFLVDSLLAWHGIRYDGPVPRPKAEPG